MYNRRFESIMRKHRDLNGSNGHSQSAPTPLPTSVTVQSKPIPRGKTVSFSPDEGWGYVGHLSSTHLVYTGAKDLWLIARSSSYRGKMLFPTDIHLASFAPGAPCEIDWGVISPLRPEDLRFTIEHRTPIKNAPPARFIARIVGFDCSGGM